MQMRTAKPPTSDPILILRGLKQGCSLPPLLFTLIIESLGQAIRTDNRIKGIVTPGSHGHEEKLSQYADDTTLLLYDDNSVKWAFHIIPKYEAGSGSKLNLE